MIMARKRTFSVIGTWSRGGDGDRPVIAGIIDGRHPVTVGEGYWARAVTATDPQDAGDAAYAEMVATIQPRIDAGERFIEEYDALVRTKVPHGSGMYGTREVADAIDEKYRFTESHLYPDSPYALRTELHWWMIEKIINHCGGDVDHFRDLFVAAGGVARAEPGYRR